MNCRQFEKLWTTRARVDLPSAARAHLAGCPACDALARSDASTDAALHRLAAAEPVPDVDAARAAIRQTLAARAGAEAHRNGGRPLAFALAAGLAAAALALLLALPALQHLAHRSVVVRRLPLQALPEREHPSIFGPSRAEEKALASPLSPSHNHQQQRSLHQPKSTPSRPEKRPSAAPLQRPGGEESHRGLRLVYAPGRAAPSDHGIAPPPRSTPRVQIAINSSNPRLPPSEGASSVDLRFLNDGSLAAAVPYSPPSAPALPLQPPPLQQVRRPGSLVLDDLLSLNPVLIASVDDSGVGTASRVIAAEAPETDPRLQQKVVVHATSRRLAELLALLSHATGVTLVPRTEVAEEEVTLWEDDRPLADVMRDLRRLHGYFWSRSKREGQYVYALWQDAQSRAREEAELQRLALEEQRQFQEGVQKRAKALRADDAELKRLAHDDPSLVAQMLHPVVRAGYQLFAALAPDQQAQLLQGQTPSTSTGLNPMSLLPREPQPGDQFVTDADFVAATAPVGDIVSLPPDERTPAQQAAVATLLKGAAAVATRAANENRQRDPDYDAARMAYDLSLGRAAATADPQTADVTLFRWGDPGGQGISLRAVFQSGGRSWVLYSSFAEPPEWDKIENDMLRQGEFGPWPGEQAELRHLLGEAKASIPGAASGPAATQADAPNPDPILDAPISVSWPLALRQGQYALSPGELIAYLHRDLPCPLVADTGPNGMREPRGGPPVFRWEKRPVRDLLRQLFKGCAFESDGTMLIIRNPDRLRWRLNQPPPAVEQFLKTRKTPLTLDDMALLSRSLTPRQVVKLGSYLPKRAIDQLLAAQDLLKLYGELAPSQREALSQGLSFTTLTPPQQALFLRFAEQQRPFVEPWQFQSGGIRLLWQPASPKNDQDGRFPIAARAQFEVQFRESDTGALPLELTGKPSDTSWDMPLADFVGQPFPGFQSITWQSMGPDGADPIHQPALADEHLRHRASVIVITRPFLEPYAGTNPPPDSGAWSRSLAEHLRGTGLPVIHVTLAATAPSREKQSPSGQLPGPTPGLIELWEPGDENVQPWDSHGAGAQFDQSPTVFVVGSDEITRAVFEGPAACDMAAIERAARTVAAR